MSQPLPIPPPGFDEISVEEQIDYVQALWDRIAERPDQIPIPAWHEEIIAERLESYRKDPSHVIPWEEVKAKAERRLRDSKR